MAGYDAFVSYSHAADSTLAPALRNGLQRFATPWRVFRFTNPTRSLRVFQDQASLSANPKLWPTIESALASSTWFILLASPVAASSPWVAREVEFWCDHKALDRLLIVQTDGEIAWNAAGGDFDWPQTTALPRRMAGMFPDEPRWIDARWARTSRHTSSRDPRFRDLVAELAAPLRGVPKDELIGEDIRQARRLARWRNAALALLTVLLASALAAAALAIRQRDLAVDRLATAQRNESRALATLAETELDRDGPTTAVRIALAALPGREGERPFVAQAEAALLHGLERLRERRRFFRPQSPVDSFALSPDSRMLATGLQDGTIELWDMASGKVLHVLRRADASEKTTVSDGGSTFSREDRFDSVTLMRFGPDGRTLVTADTQATARRWDTASGLELASLPAVQQLGLSFLGASAAASPDGRFVVLTGAQGPDPDAAPLWDAASGKAVILRHQLEPAEHRSGVRQIAFAAFSADSRRLVTSSTDWSIRVWDAASARELTALRGHTADLRFAAFSADGRTVVTASRDRTARLWELPSGKQIAVFRGHQDQITSAAVDALGRVLVTGSDDRTARLWDLTTRQELHVLRGHGDKVSSVAFSPDGRRILTTSPDQTARLWDASSAKELLVLRADSSIDTGIFTPDGQSVLTNGAGIVRMWDVGTTPESSVAWAGHQAETRSILFSPDGQSVVTAAWDDTARIWNPSSLKEEAVLRHPVFNVESAAFSPDGRLVLTRAGDGIARVWDARAAIEVPALVSTVPVAVAAFGAGGRTMVTVDGDGVVRERDVSSGAEISAHRVQEQRQADGSFGTFRRACAISADGRTLVVEWGNATVGLWGLTSRRIISVLGSPSVYAARLSPDGQRLVTNDGSSDGVATVWDTASGDKLAVLRQGRGVTAAAFSPDGRTIVTAAQGGEIRLWDADSGRELTVLGVHDSARAVAFSPDGRRVATAGFDIRIWPVALRGRALIGFGCAQVPWPLSAVQRERFGVTGEWCTPEVSDTLRGNPRVR
jgi:WD40 repeat protein